MAGLGQLMHVPQGKGAQVMYDLLARCKTFIQSALFCMLVSSPESGSFHMARSVTALAGSQPSVTNVCGIRVLRLGCWHIHTCSIFNLPAIFMSRRQHQAAAAALLAGSH